MMAVSWKKSSPETHPEPFRKENWQAMDGPKQCPTAQGVTFLVDPFFLNLLTPFFSFDYERWIDDGFYLLGFGWVIRPDGRSHSGQKLGPIPRDGVAVPGHEERR